LNPNSNRYDD